MGCRTQKTPIGILARATIKLRAGSGRLIPSLRSEKTIATAIEIKNKRKNIK